MATNDVPGFNPANKDVLAMGAWAEHEDGSLILVESVEAGTVVFSLFDVAQDPPVEYRDAMKEDDFKKQFSWSPSKAGTDKWTWHDKTPFDWTRIMHQFPAGQRAVSATATLTAAQRVAESLKLKAGQVRQRHDDQPTVQTAATELMQAITRAIGRLGR